MFHLQTIWLGTYYSFTFPIQSNRVDTHVHLFMLQQYLQRMESRLNCYLPCIYSRVNYSHAAFFASCHRGTAKNVILQGKSVTRCYSWHSRHDHRRYDDLKYIIYTFTSDLSVQQGCTCLVCILTGIRSVRHSIPTLSTKNHACIP
jgi:hypothetical protein